MALIVLIFGTVFAGVTGKILTMLSFTALVLQVWMVCRLWKCADPD